MPWEGFACLRKAWVALFEGCALRGWVGAFARVAAGPRGGDLALDAEEMEAAEGAVGVELVEEVDVDSTGSAAVAGAAITFSCDSEVAFVSGCSVFVAAGC